MRPWQTIETASYLKADDVIDWHHPRVQSTAAEIAGGRTEKADIARDCFLWVRDRIRHIHDFDIQTVSCTASGVLESRSGICYAKSHLLAALLRANTIPAGFCYQRLSRDDNGAPFCLHGFNAVYLNGVGWYRIDARGNRDDVDARFTPPEECLAFSVRLAGERDFPLILADPLPLIVNTLRTHRTKAALWQHLPDAMRL